MGRNSLVFDDINTGDYGIYISGEASFNAPARVYDMREIPGRNGTLAVDMNRYENVEVVYPAFVFDYSMASFSERMAEIRSVFLSKVSYQRLQDTYNPNEYRLAVYSGGFEIEPQHFNQTGEFELTFDCKPQRYLTSGETATTFTASGNITNPTKFASRPLIVVTGTGNVGVGNETITIDGTASQVSYIDCEMMECYKIQSGANVSINSDVTFSGTDFPTLPSGRSGVSLGSGITRVEIQPRWWRV